MKRILPLLLLAGLSGCPEPEPTAPLETELHPPIAEPEPAAESDLPIPDELDAGPMAELAERLEHATERGVFSVGLPAGHGPVQRSKRSPSSSEAEAVHSYRASAPTPPAQRYSFQHFELPRSADQDRDPEQWLVMRLPRVLAHISALDTSTRSSHQGETLWLDAYFEGMDRSQRKYGRARLARVTERDLVVLAVTGSSAEVRSAPDARAFLDSFEFVAAPPPEPGSSTCQQEFTPTTELRAISVAQLGQLLEDSQGCVTLLELYASWCPHCRTVLPAVSGIAQRQRQRGLVLHAVSTDEDQAGLQALIRSEKPSYEPLVLNPVDGAGLSALLAKRGLSFQGGVPYFALFDQQGELVLEQPGAGGMDRIEERIEALLGG